MKQIYRFSDQLGDVDYIPCPELDFVQSLCVC